MSKSIEQTLLERRSVRRYEYDPIPEGDMDFIYAAIRNTPTSYNGQQFSVIDVTDNDVKLKLYEITGQKQIKTCRHLLVFLADYHKMTVAWRAKGVAPSVFPQTVDGYTVGVIDASLAMMGAIAAAESRNLGTCPIGYLRTADPARVAEVLGLPQEVFVVCGLAIGVPREQPDVKPKQPEELVIFHDRYRSEDMSEELLHYDREITAYNQSRAGGSSDNDWISHITDYYREGEGYRLLAAARARGFLTEKN
ncbi:MAG: nitroreductase family protein [Muribaculaceae bacterium]|nr:nitroreductase family protein [Muribaculaceae bacterium]MDE6332587.1 nitroreductase family protein [Muribaculaceae bacterium]